MSRLRAILVALTILAMAAAPLLVPYLGSGSSSNSRVFAAVASAPAADNDDGDNHDGDNDDDHDNDDADNHDGDNHDGDNHDDGDNGDDDNDNGNGDDDDNDNEDDGGIVSSPVAPAPPPAPACSTPGQETTFQSVDGRVLVRVFATMPQSVRFSIRMPLDPGTVPPPPGPVVGGLLFQLIAESCTGTPIAVLPSEINLGTRYTDADAVGLNEANFTLARLDTSTNQWRTVEKQAADPPNNFASSTVSEMGFYVLYQRP